MIFAALDYIPITFKDFFYHLSYPFFIKKKSIINRSDNLIRINGYSCRSIFSTLLKLLKSQRKNIKILTTPIHHTSFRDIIEEYIKPENIYILELNDEYNKIINIPKIDNKDIIVDACIVTHVFGQDLNCELLKQYKIENPNCYIIEDRVQGAEFEKIFSDNCFDISLYSTGMDKRPCGLGGGIMFIKKNNRITKNTDINILSYLNSYRYETTYGRVLFLIKKFPTFLLYNFKIIIKLLLYIFKFFKINIHSFSCKYRKYNPGFTHENYNIFPNNGTLYSIDKSLNDYKNIEILYKKKSQIFYSKLQPVIKKKLIPWLIDDKNYSLTPYNTIIIKNTVKFIDYLNSKNIVVIENPTYKIFNFSYVNSEKYKKFNNSLVYIPSLSIMDDREIEYLAELLNSYT